MRKNKVFIACDTTNINKLKYEDPVEGPLILNNYWEVRISHSNRDLLELINQKLISHIEFFAIKNISGQYRNILQKRIVERNPEIKRLRNEIDIISISINDYSTQTYTEKETDYSKLLLEKKLELAYWENLNTDGLLSDLNQLTENIVNKPIHLIADKKIIKNF